VTTTSPAEANAKPMSAAASGVNSAHGEWTSPAAVTTPRNAVLTSAPRDSAQPTSPSAMSRTVMGALSMDSYVWSSLSFAYMLNVVSFMAPFIAAVASRAGATKAA
jgi:hypothetical protein